MRWRYTKKCFDKLKLNFGGRRGEKSIDHNLEILIIWMEEAGLSYPARDLLMEKADISLMLLPLWLLRRRLLFIFFTYIFERWIS